MLRRRVDADWSKLTKRCQNRRRENTPLSAIRQSVTLVHRNTELQNRIQNRAQIRGGCPFITVPRGVKGEAPAATSAASIIHQSDVAAVMLITISPGLQQQIQIVATHRQSTRFLAHYLFRNVLFLATIYLSILSANHTQGRGLPPGMLHLHHHHMGNRIGGGF